MQKLKSTGLKLRQNFGKRHQIKSLIKKTGKFMIKVKITRNFLIYQKNSDKQVLMKLMN